MGELHCRTERDVGSRAYDAHIQPLLDAFTEKTGIETEVLFLDKGLEDRIAAEGSNSPADVILTVDIGRLMNAKGKGHQHFI